MRALGQDGLSYKSQKIRRIACYARHLFTKEIICMISRSYSINKASSCVPHDEQYYWYIFLMSHRHCLTLFPLPTRKALETVQSC